MIKNLEYEVTFPSTGKSFAFSGSFEKGLTAIIGPNEAGKSLTLEFIRYMLFGTDALRGKAPDYKTFKGEMGFAVKGKAYRVARSGSKATLAQGDEVLATGTTAVNAAIVRLLGFGLTVFDTACNCGQGEIEALGNMQPTERKRMVDSVIGIGVIDDLVKWAGDEALSKTRLADGLETALQRPVEPVKPEGYQPSEEVATVLRGLRAKKAERDQLVGWLSHIKTKPTEPVCDIKDSISDLQTHQAARQEAVGKVQGLESRLRHIPAMPAGVTAETIEAGKAALDRWEKAKAKKRFIQEHPRPEHSPQELAGWRADWALLEKFIELEHLQSHLKNYEEAGTHECPACHHSWPVEASAIAGIEAEIAELGLEGRTKPERPPLTPKAIEVQEERWVDWAQPDVEEEGRLMLDIDENAPPATYNWEQLARMNGLLELQGERDLITAQIAAIEIPNDRNADLKKLQLYEAAKTAWFNESHKYELWVKERAEKQTKLAEYEGIEELIAQLELLLLACVTYERDKAAYDSNLRVFQERESEIAGLKIEAEGWKRGKSALQVLKAKIKQHLVPSLNKVASVLLNQMTAGKRQVVNVDEEFNIEIDGQPLNTLSGSGKAVANLAIRIGLGQVLTNGVLSLFMADEIDAAMDDERAAATHECVRNLTGLIKQILLVSHKMPEADNYIEVKAA